jgi:hypothetical protein
MTDTVEIDGAIERRTNMAILFHTGNKEEAVWLPLSQVTVDYTSKSGFGGIHTVTMPTWLAEKEGLI